MRSLPFLFSLTALVLLAVGPVAQAAPVTLNEYDAVVNTAEITTMQNWNDTQATSQTTPNKQADTPAPKQATQLATATSR